MHVQCMFRNKRFVCTLFWCAVGEPINAEAWHWYHEIVGEKRCPIVDTWWQTGKAAYISTYFAVMIIIFMKLSEWNVIVFPIIPFWYSLEAYQVSLVKLWMLVRILERCCLAKIPMVRPNKHDIPSTHTKTKRTEWVLLYPNSAKSP